MQVVFQTRVEITITDWFKQMNTRLREHSGSVVECLTGDRGVVGSSLAGVTACVLEQDTVILA